MYYVTNAMSLPIAPGHAKILVVHVSLPEIRKIFSLKTYVSGIGTRGAGGAAAPLYFWWAILQYWHFLINFA